MSWVAMPISQSGTPDPLPVRTYMALAGSMGSLDVLARGQKSSHQCILLASLAGPGRVLLVDTGTRARS